MKLHSEAAVLELKAGELLVLEDSPGASILARCGSVWVTEEGEPRDFVLGAGEKRVVAHPGRTLIQAMSTSWISIRNAQAIAA